jgi:hypothetical protein
MDADEWALPPNEDLDVARQLRESRQRMAVRVITAIDAYKAANGWTFP